MTAPLPVRSWRIWYGDGSVFSSADGSWADAPRHGVQVVMLYHDPPYRSVINGEDAYQLEGESQAKYGSLTGEAEFSRILDEAMAATEPP